MIKIYRNGIKVLDNSKASFKLDLLELFENTVGCFKTSEGYSVSISDISTLEMLNQIDKVRDYRVSIG